LKAEDDYLCSLQLRKKTLIINNKEVDAYLIIAVSTHPDKHRQGHMKRLMDYVLNKYNGSVMLIQAYN
jgi:hypothetical protein